MGRRGRRKTARDAHRHARRRALERYGVDLSTADLERLAAQIRDGRADFVMRESGQRTHWVVEHDGRPMLTVYQKNIGALLTFLPADLIPAEA